MLPKLHRLTNSDQILETIRTGRSKNTPYFRLKLKSLDNTHPDSFAPTKIAFVCSKKQLKRAVDRNRVQRRLRAQLTPLLPQLKPGYQLVFLIQSASLQASSQELQTAVQSQLESLLSPRNG